MTGFRGARRGGAVLSLALLAVLAACGGSGSGGGSGTTAPDALARHCFPLEVGKRWAFESQTGDRLPIIKQIGGTRSVNGQTDVDLSSTDPAEGESVLLESSAGITQVPGTNADPRRRRWGPFLLLKSPVRFGTAVPLPPEPSRKSRIQVSSVGDLNGDARADVVVAWEEFDEGPYNWKSMIQPSLQQANGSLVPGQLIPLPAGLRASALRIADLDGSGTAQILCGTSTSGVQV